MISDMSIENGLDNPVMPIPDNKNDRPTPVECFYAHVGYQLDSKGLSEVSQWVQRLLGERMRKTVKEVPMDGNGKLKVIPLAANSGIKRPLACKPEGPSKKQCLQPQNQLVPYKCDSKVELENLLRQYGKQVDWTTRMLGQSGPWSAHCHIDGKHASTGKGQKKMDAIRDAAAKALTIPRIAEMSKLIRYDNLAAVRKSAAKNVVLKDRTIEVGKGGMGAPIPVPMLPLQTPTMEGAPALKADPVRSEGKTLQGIQQDTLQRHGSSLMDRFKQWMISTGKATSIIYTEKLQDGGSVWNVECLVDGVLVGYGKGYGTLAAAMKQAAITATTLVTRLKVHERMTNSSAKANLPVAQFQPFDAGECIV